VAVDRRPDTVRESEKRPIQDGGLHNEEDNAYHQEITNPVNKKPSAASRINVWGTTSKRKQDSARQHY
jgi:hypothetical protein